MSITQKLKELINKEYEKKFNEINEILSINTALRNEIEIYKFANMVLKKERDKAINDEYEAEFENRKLQYKINDIESNFQKQISQHIEEKYQAIYEKDQALSLNKNLQDQIEQNKKENQDLKNHINLIFNELDKAIFEKEEALYLNQDLHDQINQKNDVNEDLQKEINQLISERDQAIC